MELKCTPRIIEKLKLIKESLLIVPIDHKIVIDQSKLEELSKLSPNFQHSPIFNKMNSTNFNVTNNVIVITFSQIIELIVGEGCRFVDIMNLIDKIVNRTELFETTDFYFNDIEIHRLSSILSLPSMTEIVNPLLAL